MARKHTLFVCQECGHQSPRWLGRCGDCGAWNSLVEEIAASPAADTGKGWRASARRDTRPTAYSEVGTQKRPRSSTGIGGLDLVLGGGLVPGSLVLIAGEPGAGKSTLMLQAAAKLSGKRSVLYVTGEESEAQVKLRGDRLGINPESLYVFCETDLDRVIETFEKLSPGLMVVDSVQTVYSPRFSSAPGSVSQVREAAAQLLVLAKTTDAPIFLVGHVTKEGLIAGPKTMEHIVDTVVMMEGERFQSFRTLRALKNRFGPVSEIAVFEMRSNGLVEVENPSELFLAERAEGSPGSAVTATVVGTRPLLVEVQALVSPAEYGSGRRTAEGFDHNRLALLLAVLERRGGLGISNSDVYVNVVGGVRLSEPAVDLAVVAAIASSLLDKPLRANGVFIGELGLGGEVRSVTAADLRLKEASAIGMTEIFLPARNAKALKGNKSLVLHPVKSLIELLECAF